jgi:hypothetical protein
MGPAGAAGGNGANGINAFTTLTAGFTMPAEQANLLLAVANGSWTTVGEVLFIQSAGYVRVVAVPSPTQLTIKNLANSLTGEYTSNTAPGIAIPNGMSVVAAGVEGPAGPTGLGGPMGPIGNTGSTGATGPTGHDAATSLTAPFTMPNRGDTVTVQVIYGLWTAIGSILFVQNAGYMRVVEVGSVTMELRNIATATEYTSNIAPGTTVSELSGLCPTGMQGPAGNTQNTAFINISNSLAQGTDGPAIVAGSWQDVPLNTINSDSQGIVISLAANEITLPAGAYRVRGAAPAFKGGNTVLRTCNVTTGINTTAKPERGADEEVQINATLDARIVLPATQTIKFQQLCSSTITGGVLGKAANLTGVNEIHARFVLEKELS